MSLAGDDTMSDRHVGPGLRHHAWGPEVHIIILSEPRACPTIAPGAGSACGRSTQCATPIPSLAGRPRRRGPYSTIAICISQGSLTCEVALASSHEASRSPLTLMQGRHPLNSTADPLTCIRSHAETYDHSTM